jgi:Mg2+ and Co2+ transporter CorA
LRAHLAEYADRIDKLEDQLQAAAGADDYFSLLQAIAPLHRTVRNLHAALQQAREMAPDDRDLITLRDQSGDLERAAELLHGDAKNGLDYTIARQTEEQTRRSYEMAVAAHRLNLLAAVFFPIATLTSIFGMNLVHPLAQFPAELAFWGVVGVGLFSGLILTLAIANRPTAPAERTRHVRNQREFADLHRDPSLRPSKVPRQA